MMVKVKKKLFLFVYFCVKYDKIIVLYKIWYNKDSYKMVEIKQYVILILIRLYVFIK